MIYNLHDKSGLSETPNFQTPSTGTHSTPTTITVEATDLCLTRLPDFVSIM